MDEGAAFTAAATGLRVTLLKLAHDGCPASGHDNLAQLFLNQRRQLACAAHHQISWRDGRITPLAAPICSVQLPPVASTAAPDRLCPVLAVGCRTVGHDPGESFVPYPCWLWPWDDAPFLMRKGALGPPLPLLAPILPLLLVADARLGGRTVFFASPCCPIAWRGKAWRARSPGAPLSPGAVL